jgi:pyruvate dehydrogenase E2 component (dihydrolipoamide acetyltransferase)
LERSGRRGVGANRERYVLERHANPGSFGPKGRHGWLGANTAMSTQIEMPELSSEGEGATLATWLVSVGDRVEKGDVIAEIETDKATVELEAPAAGKIVAFAVEEGTEGIMPGTLLGSLDPEASSMPAEPSTNADAAPIEEGSTSTTAVETKPAVTSDASPEELNVARSATPLARRAALDREVDLTTVTGSGPGGRVVEEDVLRLVDSDPAEAPSGEPASTGPGAATFEVTGSFEAVRLSTMRKTVARRMAESKQQVPHFYLRMRCSMDAVLEYRAGLNRDLAGEGRDTKISVNDFILRAAALALRDVPAANVRFAGNEMHVFDHVDISVAVATDGGLVTPVVRNADRKGLATLANEVKALALQAREGKLRPEQYQGGTFTISNLGMYGIETVYPILNPPQACILGVGAAEEQPVVRNGEVVIGRVAAITLAADHRVVDGAVGAQFMAALRERLEEPLRLML